MFITEYDRFANQIVVNDSIPEQTSQVTHFMVEFPFSVRMTWASNQLFECSEQVDNKIASIKMFSRRNKHVINCTSNYSDQDVAKSFLSREETQQIQIIGIGKDPILPEIVSNRTRTNVMEAIAFWSIRTLLLG